MAAVLEVLPCPSSSPDCSPGIRPVAVLDHPLDAIAALRSRSVSPLPRLFQRYG